MNNIIDKKLTKFINRYYKNLVARGAVYTLILLIIFFVLLNIIEYFSWNTPIVRSIVFYAYIALAVLVIAIWIIRPLLKLSGIGKTLSKEQSARIIGKYFPEINDKLLNLLQLKELSENSTENSLLIAAIDQKTQDLKPLPFQKAVNTTKTKHYGRILFYILAGIVILFLVFPRLFSEPSMRYINHNTFYEKPAPFHFTLESMQKAIQQSDYNAKVKVQGDILPERVNIIIDGQSFEMKKNNKTHFSHTIMQIQKTVSLQFEAAGVKSKIYKIVVNPKPVLTSISAEISYPKYTKIENSIITNLTDISVPKGTKIRYFIDTKDCSEVIFNKRNFVPKRGRVEISHSYLSNQNVLIRAKNPFTLSSDSIAFAVSIVEDMRPNIAVIEQQDSLTNDNIYFRGQINDDYGFSRLMFHIKITPQNGDKIRQYGKNLKNINNEETMQEFYHAEYLNDYNIHPGDKVEYYFEVWDNDAVNGAKSSRSQNFVLNIPTQKEVESKIESNSSNIKQEADNALKDIKRLQKEINELTKHLTEKSELTWQDKKDLEAIKEKQEEIRDKISNIEKKIEDNSRMEEKYNNVDKELLDKQKQIEELFKELQNKDLENLIKEMQKLMQENIDKNKLNQNLENIKRNNEEISKQLDKNIELFKRLEVEKNINETIDKLKELSKKQEDLSEETLNKNNDKNSLEKKQEDLQKEFKDLQQKIKDLKDKDSKLEDPFGFKQDKNKEAEINKDQAESKGNLNKNKRNQAAKSQKSAAKKMQEMAENMEEEQQDSQEEQLAEDIDNVRQILKNLVTLSKREEDLIYLTQKTSVSDPQYQKIINQQNIIKNSMQQTADSLYAISKRQTQVSKTINDETYKAINNIDKSLYTLLRFNQSIYQNYHNNQAAKEQQTAMSGINNLSLLLAESLDNMNKQQQQSKQKGGKASKMCSNPSQSKNGKNPQNIHQLQESLNKEIERLEKELQKRGNKQKSKIGENSKLNEELARAAAQQEIIRKMMQQYLKEMESNEGKSAGDMNKILQNMEQTEKDIVNKSIDKRTINRQNQILTRMLESERAEKKKGKEEKRESKSGEDKQRIIDKNFEAFKKLKNRDVELIKKNPPQYSPYYKAKIQKYFSNFEN